MDWASCVSGASQVATIRCIPVIVVNLVNAIFVFIGFVAIFIIIFAGTKYLRSRGDQAAIDDAKRTLTYGIVGLLVIFFAFFFIRIITTATGITQLNPFVPVNTPGTSEGIGGDVDAGRGEGVTITPRPGGCEGEGC